MVRSWTCTFLLGFGALLPRSAAAQESSQLLVIVGADTISREQFSRTATQLSAEMLSPAVGVRFRFTVAYGADGVPTRMDNAFWQPTDPDSAPARQRAAILFRSDSVIVAIAGGATQRFASEHGAIPFINPSFALMELFLQRARALGGDSVRIPAFAVQGGQTVPVLVIRRGGDSVEVNLAGAVLQLRVDRADRILSGSVAAQNLRVVRTAANPGGLTAVPPDYSAPAGAPYQAIEVQVPTPAGHTLAGTLTIPAGAGPTARVPAVVTITGSGLEDRDESLPGVSGYHPFRQLADTLSRHGIAVLRMDDRGYGSSGGNGGTATSRDFADDIRAGLAWLRARPEIDPARLALVGHSEGGLIAPLVATTDTTLRGIVLLVGPSRTGKEIITYQQRGALDRAPNLTAHERDSLMAEAQATLENAARSSPWMQQFLSYDPLPTARQVRRTPVLIIQGATDLQVLPNQAPELEAAFKAAGNRDVTMRIFPEANHLLIQDPDGSPEKYASLPQRVVRADILGTVLDWLRVRLR